jgi:predicted nucleic acid-binding Zn ribbon protein
MPSSKGWKTRAEERTMRDTPIGSIVDELLVRERAFARGLPIGRLAAEWGEVVGPRLGSQSAPVSLDGGVLVVAASSGPWGAQVRFMTEEIRRRANERLGAEVVAKVQVTVRPDPQKPL